MSGYYPDSVTHPDGDEPIEWDMEPTQRSKDEIEFIERQNELRRLQLTERDELIASKNAEIAVLKRNPAIAQAEAAERQAAALESLIKELAIGLDNINDAAQRQAGSLYGIAATLERLAAQAEQQTAHMERIVMVLSRIVGQMEQRP